VPSWCRWKRKKTRRRRRRKKKWCGEGSAYPSGGDVVAIVAVATV
jgi:hypothetical protein